MRVELKVTRGDQEVQIELTPETYDISGDDRVIATYGPDIDQLVDQAGAMAKAAMEAGK
jgi:hypothetical protein